MPASPKKRSAALQRKFSTGPRNALPWRARAGTVSPEKNKENKRSKSAAAPVVRSPRQSRWNTTLSSRMVSLYESDSDSAQPTPKPRSGKQKRKTTAGPLTTVRSNRDRRLKSAAKLNIPDAAVPGETKNPGVSRALSEAPNPVVEPVSTPRMAKGSVAKPNVSLLSRLEEASIHEDSDTTDSEVVVLPPPAKTKRGGGGQSQTSRKEPLERAVTPRTPTKTKNDGKNKPTHLPQLNAARTPNEVRSSPRRQGTNTKAKTSLVSSNQLSLTSDRLDTPAPQRRNPRSRQPPKQAKKKPAIVFPSKRITKTTVKKSPVKRGSTAKMPAPPPPRIQPNMSMSIRQQSQPSSSAAPSFSRHHQSTAGTSRSQRTINLSLVAPSRKHTSIFETLRNGSVLSDEEETPERYVGDDVMGNYNMMKHKEVANILNSAKPDHGLNAEEVELLSIRVNHWLEDFFVHHCNETQHPYGFIPFRELKQALIDQCLLEEDAPGTDLLKEMKHSFSKEDWKRSEGILYPSRYIASKDTDEFPFK